MCEIRAIRRMTAPLDAIYMQNYCMCERAKTIELEDFLSRENYMAV